MEGGRVVVFLPLHNAGDAVAEGDVLFFKVLEFFQLERCREQENQADGYDEQKDNNADAGREVLFWGVVRPSTQ